MAYIPVIARIQSLPPLPESVLEIESLYAQGDPDIDTIVKIIESDPLLTADILVKVNAPLYGFSRTIVSILQAVTLFGSVKIRSLVLYSSLHRDFDIDLTPYAISTLEFSQVSKLQSDLIFQWYMSVNIDLARTLTPIAFLMETGKILIAKDIISNKKEIDFLEALSNYEDIANVESIFTSMTTAEINALIFKHLNLSDIFSEAMAYLDVDKQAPKSIEEIVIALRIVRAAVNIQQQLTENSLQEALKLLQKSNLQSEPFLRAVARVKKHHFKL